MKIIEKIEIKHFRSFLGTPKEFELIVDNIVDLNIFSGSNDSGKSNILRSLNLFFNKEVLSGLPFEFNRDFFIGKKESGHRVIEISISFDLSKDDKRDKFLPEKFTISKYYDRDGFRNSVYSFRLKEIDKPIKVDDRSEKNNHIANLFTPENATDEQKEAAKKREWNYRVKFAGFLNKSVSFEYVPAIRDKNFFAQLFGRVITKIKTNEENRLSALEQEKNKIIHWNKTIKNKTEKKDFKENLTNKEWRLIRLKEIENQTKTESKLAATISGLEFEINNYASNLIKSVGFLESEFKVGKDLQDFFEGFDIGTGSEKSISLGLRGDGVQAKFVPKILNFLSEIDHERKYFIWGFEEPENSAEYKNQQELSLEFKSAFSKNKQIFITTHSEEFLHIYDGSDLEKTSRTSNLYHVKKMTSPDYGDYSMVYLFDPDQNEFESQKTLLENDLGQSYLRAKYSKELKNTEDRFLKEKQELQRQIKDFEAHKIETTKPLVFVEDSYDQIYKIAWLKLRNIHFSQETLDQIFFKKCPFSLYRSEGATNLAGFLRAKNIDIWKDRKVIGLFDFDKEGTEQFNNIKNESYWREPTAGDKASGIYRKRSNHPCFCALLLPIPERLSLLADLHFTSYIEIENLLPETFLLENKLVTKVPIAGGAEYLDVADGIKPNLWKKLIETTPDHFHDFKPLFDKISELFGIIE